MRKTGAGNRLALFLIMQISRRIEVIAAPPNHSVQGSHTAAPFYYFYFSLTNKVIYRVSVDLFGSLLESPAPIAIKVIQKLG